MDFSGTYQKIVDFSGDGSHASHFCLFVCFAKICCHAQQNRMELSVYSDMNRQIISRMYTVNLRGCI